MRILAFSDLHRDRRAARSIVDASGRADILVGAGDFANCGVGLADCIEILALSRAPVVLVPGNHEPYGELVDLCADIPHIFVLHGGGVTLGGVRFFGLGGEIPSRNDAAWNQALPEETAAEILSRADAFDILVTHTPPFGCADLQRDGSHEGSKAIADALHMRLPLLHLCGHVHFSWGAEGIVGSTLVRNLGPAPNWFDI